MIARAKMFPGDMPWFCQLTCPITICALDITGKRMFRGPNETRKTRKKLFPTLPTFMARSTSECPHISNIFFAKEEEKRKDADCCRHLNKHEPDRWTYLAKNTGTQCWISEPKFKEDSCVQIGWKDRRIMWTSITETKYLTKLRTVKRRRHRQWEVRHGLINSIYSQNITTS